MRKQPANLKKDELKRLPFMLYADKVGRIYDHPYYRMAGMSGEHLVTPKRGDLVRFSKYGKLFYIPECPPVGIDPKTGEFAVVPEIEVNGRRTPCFAVAGFLEPGEVRTLLPAVDYGPQTYLLPMWAYTAIGFKDGQYQVASFRVEYNPRWDPANYDDRELMPAMDRYRKAHGTTPLVEHLADCAVHNHCFAAKNLFLGRWEAPIPVSRTCNAACLGCLSLQAADSCTASHQRIRFTPSRAEIVSLAVAHLTRSPEAIVSFGQGCEGEPLTEFELIRDSIRDIRARTARGTINLNTNGSKPEQVRKIIETGLDSIRISLNSARESLYHAYYRPRDYGFEQVVETIALAKQRGVYTMINYLVFPGITDQKAEIEALSALIRKTGIDFIHVKNLCLDPSLYLETMPCPKAKGIGMKRMFGILKKEFPNLKLGYFNQPVR